MKNYWKKLIEHLSDDKFMGIEFFLMQLIFSIWVLIILGLIGYFLG